MIPDKVCLSGGSSLGEGANRLGAGEGRQGANIQFYKIFHEIVGRWINLFKLKLWHTLF